MKLKRIVAVIILSVLFLSLIATICVAIFSTDTRLLFALLFIDIVMPVIVYAYLVITKQIRALNKDDKTNEK